MKSRFLILVILLLSIAFVGQAFGASTLTPYPTKAPKGAYVNGGGVQADDNFFWQMLTLTTVDAEHASGTAVGDSMCFTLYLPTSMTVADVDNDGNYADEISYVWKDTDAGSEFVDVVLNYVNATNSAITFEVPRDRASNGGFTGDATGWTLADGAAYNANNLNLVVAAQAAASTATQAVRAKIGETYLLTYTTSGVANDPRVTPTLGGAAGTARTTAATFSELITATTTGSLIFLGEDISGYPGDATVTIDDVSVRPIHADQCLVGGFDASGLPWLYGNGWALSVGTASHPVANAALVAPLQQDVKAFAGDYVVKFDVGAGAGTVTPGIGGGAGSAATCATTNNIQVITATGAGNLTFTPDATFTGSIDNVSVYRVYSASTMEVGDKVYVMVPVETSVTPSVSSDDWYVDFLDGTDDDITNGSGTAVTYVDPGPTTLSLATFADNLSADNDTTNTIGDKYPTSSAATFGALPDMVVDGTAGDGFIQQNNAGVTLNGTEGGTETLYCVWISTDPNLAHIDSLSSGIFQAKKYTDLSKYLVNETSTGGVQYALGGYPEGSYYFYITSYLTGDFPLARSGKLVVRHWPEINLVGFDRDHDGAYTTGGGNDDQNLTLDSGSYFDYSGTKASTGQYTYVDLYTSVDDLDDNATVSLFYSTNASIDTSAVQRSGDPAAGTMTITGLTGAEPLASNLLENSEDEQGYIKYRWQIHPDSLGLVLSADSYTIYAITTDGKHFDLTSLMGVGSTNLTTTIKHSPNLTIDALDEYDGSVAAGVQVDVKSIDTMMLSWGKTGVNGALDYDDSAVISFYIHKDTNTVSDYDHRGYTAGDASTVWNDAATDPTTTHQIVTGLQEDLDSKGNMYYAWDLKEDFASSGWYPTDGSNYFIYAVVDENKTGGTVRCVTLGSNGDFYTTATDLAGEQIVFTNSAFSRLTDPPIEGVTINAEETYRLRFNAFDWDTNANLGFFVVKNTSTGYEDGPMTTTTAALDTLGSTAYMLSDNDGNYHAGNVTVSENSATYYDATIRIPGSATAKYTTTMGGTATDLADGTYWVYVGSTKESSFGNKVTNGTFTGAATGWTLGGTAAYNANNLNLAVANPGTAEQNVTVVVGRSYMITYTLSGIGGGCSVTPTLGGADGVARTADGTYNEVVTATTTGNLIFTAAGAGGSVVLDDVTVVPYVTVYRAPGPLTVVNAGVAASQRNLTVSPVEATVARGDTVTFSIRGADNGADVDRIDSYIAVEKEYWTLVSTSSPFTASLAFTGKMIANTVIDDSTNNRWIFQSVIFDGGNTLSMSDTGVGDVLATVQLVSKGTGSALQEQTSIYYVNQPSHGWVSRFSNNGTDISINSLASTIKIIPRPIIEGIVELDGRNDMGVPITFELRKRGSYAPLTDSLFIAVNDADSTSEGIQFTPDSEGKFTFTQVPVGEYDLIASYRRYLSGLVQVNVYPGLDTLFVSFGVLEGGDCIGYTDSLSYVYPDNQIDAEDINRISTAFLSTPSDTEWDNGSDNWKWADINEDDVVNATDLSMATANVGSNGAQPRYKTAGDFVATNATSTVEFANVPSTLKMGESYTIQVIAHNAAEVRAYFVNMNYDTSIFSFAGIQKGDFIAADSYSFPVVGSGAVGLANSVYGDEVFSGDGVLAEVTFTALQDGAFSADIISFETVALVNAEFVQEDLVKNTTGITENTPVVFSLDQNFPNPFNPSTTIGFTLPEASRVSIEIYDILGRRVRTLASGAYAAGKYSVIWDGRDANGHQASTGIYLYRIQAGNYSSTKRMTFMK